jgi:hypothetical protein
MGDFPRPCLCCVYIETRGATMTLIIGILLLVGGVVAIRFASPRKGTPRRFVGTPLEIPVVLVIVLAICIGVILAIGGAVS